LGITVVTTGEIRRKGVEKIVRETNVALRGCTDIYISFDVDCIDPSISKGTGTPASDGLREREAEELVGKFMQNSKVCCFELCEVNPTLDRENSMAEIAFDILERTANALLMS